MPAAVPPAAHGGWRDGWRDGLSYGALGLPLAFVALPLYVVLPNHYAEAFGVPLAWLGALLLAARLLDAVVDPWIGRQCDRWFAHSAARVLAISGAAALALAIGFFALFFPPMRDLPGLLAWCGATLALSYLSYSVLSIVHQSWGARLGGDAPQRARIVSWREGLSLVGVLLASVLSSTLGPAVTSAVLALSLGLGLAALRRAPRAPAGAAPSQAAPMRLALANPSFRRLLTVYLVNGIASAIPATLVLFFIRDRLQAPAFEPLFLGSYFLAAALSMPLWLRAVSRFGLARSWLAGMLLAIASFVWAALLGAGDVLGFAAVCLASGVALGADLSLPGALLAGVIRRAGHQGRAEGMYFGWWNFATKLNLALAAGIALPLLGLFGYAPGSRDGAALDALTLAYCALPCVLKLIAAALLYTRWMRSPEGSTE
ncbi:MAG: MFS transporter [Burkholderiaceae bacterium]|nr:MFS transporter [Burkholderiaceae bacterium]